MNKEEKKSEVQNVVGEGTDSFAIVGIGASAGGLAAFEAFFSGMPADTDPNMAIVLVQHLDPDHKSLLADLIRRRTRMQVFEVEDGMMVRPNCAYIIPPNRDMAFLNGTLQLLEPSSPRGQRMPIDFFFRSLAHDQQERAICVVLSGTGSDGTLGVRDIKEEGGIVIVQTPESAEFDGMPRSVISTGMADYVLDPDKMPSQIIGYTSHAFDKLSRSFTAAALSDEASLKKIFILLRSQVGHDFSQYKEKTIMRRIQRRMAVNQIDTLERYTKYLQQMPMEVNALFDDLLIGVTYFFRDPEAFKSLEEQVIPLLFVNKNTGDDIRVWSAGCSTGEEAYSLAILLAEHQEKLKKSFKIQVFATDIDSNAIATARTGIYPSSIEADISQERLSRFFVNEQESNKYRICKSIRDTIVFSEQDLIKDPPFSKMDLICCRNLLIYMNRDLQKKIIPLFHYSLNPGGFLFLGASGSISYLNAYFSVLDRKSKIYQRKEDFHSSQNVNPSPFLLLKTDITTMQPAKKNSIPEKPSLRELTETMLLQYVTPAAVLVNSQGDILYIHGRTGMYLEPTPGEAGVNNIIKMAREGLQRDLTVSLHKAVGGKELVQCPGLSIKTNDHTYTINLTVRPVMSELNGKSENSLYLITLEEAPNLELRSQQITAALNSIVGEDEFNLKDAEAQILTLKQELRAKDEYLYTTKEELETSNEELKSSNEELQSVNEELQSTNEELETSKEELQSVNEELATVNAELQTKVVDLGQANNDMNNLLAGTGIGTVFVDVDLHILRFTPSVTQIINLIQSDVGRPVGHIVSNLVEYNNLVEDTQAVLDTLVPKEMEVQTNSGTWYAMRIQPYRTLDNVIEGAVVTFADITSSINLQKALRLNEERLRVALKVSPVMVFNQDEKLCYTWVYNPNAAFSSYSIIGKTDHDILTAEEASRLSVIKKQVLESGVGFRSEVFISTNGKQLSYNLTVDPLYDISDGIIGITGVLMASTN
ncbi:chemotaxis protein CheB [Methanolobus tindarius]|nr:chemotaxis protein CheB [Methanolobus tindarius]